jgi:hypothetical protein
MDRIAPAVCRISLTNRTLFELIAWQLIRLAPEYFPTLLHLMLSPKTLV